jgi:eukaryotic-like serine/threonine-protein kinase
VRTLLGDGLLERAALAEQERRLPQRDELIQRLAAYDDGGERRWSAPARVAVDSSPAGAEVMLARFEAQGGRRALGRARVLGATPLAEQEIEQRSYVLSFAAEGRAPVRLPIVLARGEHRRWRSISLRSRVVPGGFVYVPPGRFLFGMAEDGEARRMFERQPLRPIRGGRREPRRDVRQGAARLRA